MLQVYEIGRLRYGDGLVMIALKLVEHDIKRSFGIAFITSLIALLVYQQFGSVLHRLESFGAFEREFRADFIVYMSGPPGRFTPPLRQPLPESTLARVPLHPDVRRFAPYSARELRWHLPNMSRSDDAVYIIQVPADDVPMALPASFPDYLLDLVQADDTMIITDDLSMKYSMALGETITLGSRGVLVAAVLPVQSYGPLVVMSENTYNAMAAGVTRQNSSTGPLNQRTSANAAGGRHTAVLVTFDERVDKRLASLELQSLLGHSRIRVVTPSELAAEIGIVTLLAENNERAFVITAIFTFLICIFIVAQTIRSAIFNLRDEFSVLIALGASTFSVRLICLEFSLFIGILSTVLSIFLAYVMRIVASYFDVYLVYSFDIFVFTSLIIMCIIFLSGLIASFAIDKFNPTQLLR